MIPHFNSQALTRVANGVGFPKFVWVPGDFRRVDSAASLL